MADADPEFWRGVREGLRAAGIPNASVALPGDAGLPWQGALTVTGGGDAWQLATVDYGVSRRVFTRTSRDAIVLALRQDIALFPLPTPQPLTAEERERMLDWAAPHVLDLANRARSGVVIELPPGLLVDRLGALDGIFLYPSGTSFEARSLPPDVLQQPLQEFVTTSTFRVIAAVTPPWFGRPGGGVRFEIADPAMEVRDLVREGFLSRVTTA